MKRAPVLIVTLTILLTASTAMAADVVDTTAWSKLLATYVDSHGQVDYAGWHDDKKDRARLNAFLDKVAHAHPDQQGEHAQLAFYINAYNATVIDSVLDKWPVKSVMKEPGFFKSQTHPIAGKDRTLNQLEHKLIRPTFKDPRVHFVLVCAAKSCPRLRPKAVTAKNVESVLESAAREFIPAATTADGATVTTSQIFKWYGSDFDKKAGSVQAYLAKYTDGDLADLLDSGKATLKFSTYDWALNAQ